MRSFNVLYEGYRIVMLNRYNIWNVTHFLRFMYDRFQGISSYGGVLINAACIQVFLSIWGRDVLTIFGKVLLFCTPPHKKQK